MKRNNCARCGKVERFGRVFECISHNDAEFFLCVECAQILYKAEDARKEGKDETENELRDSFTSGIKNSTSKSILLDWITNKLSTD